MKKRIRTGLSIAAFVVLVALISMRIAYVNRHARLPEVKWVPQGQTAEYRGLQYTVVSAKLWDYEEFFKTYENLSDYQMQGRSSGDTKILIVEYRLEKMQDDNVLDFYIPIQYAYLFNGVDVFMAQDMNPSVADGTFASGDIMTIPYEIYRENLTQEQWDAVNSLDMEYQTVLGTYPVKTEMQIEEVRP